MGRQTWLSEGRRELTLSSPDGYTNSSARLKIPKGKTARPMSEGKVGGVNGRWKKSTKKDA